MYVVETSKSKPDMNVAGVKKVAKKGEENIYAIWPSDTPQDSYNVRNRSLDVGGIEQKAANARRARLQALDR